MDIFSATMPPMIISRTAMTSSTHAVVSRDTVTLCPYRSSLKFGSTAGRFGAFATYQPVRYIHCVMRSSFG